MATSPKFRPALLPRYSSTNSTSTTRRYSQQQLILIVSFVLLITSGTMLVFHVITSPLSTATGRNAVGCGKDADFTTIRWKQPSRSYEQNNVKLDVDANPYGSSHDRNAGRSSNDNIKYNEYYEDQRSNNQNHDSDKQQLSNQDREPPVQDGHNNKGIDNTDEDGDGEEIGEEIEAEEEEEEEEEEEVEYLPFEDTLDQDNNVKYITYLPYAGITNQFYGILRGLEVAKKLGRTLIIPPITASSHDKSKQNQPWSKFLDLDRFQELTGAKVIEFHKLRDAEMTEFNQLDCKITCGFGSKRTIDFTAKGFLQQWKFNVTLSPLQIDANKLEPVTQALNPYRQDKFICISNTYKIIVKDKSEWDRFGQHLHFTPELENFVQEFLDRNLVKPEPVYDPRSRQEIVPTQKYIAIHARRGDFAQYCESNFAGPKMVHCFPTTDEIARRIDRIQTKNNPSGSFTDIMPVFVATNERRPEELKKFADLGWTYLDHDQMGTVETLGTFGPMMVDQVFMAHAQALVGIQMSTFSRVGALRQRDWHKREVEYM